jgi:uncharacterized protein
MPCGSSEAGGGPTPDPSPQRGGELELGVSAPSSLVGEGRGGGGAGPIIRLAGVDLLPDLTGALYMPDTRTLIAADLHFEKGSSRGANGVHLPPYDTRSTLDLLATAVARWRPERLVLLGDSFHDEQGPGRLDGADLASIAALARATEIIWITGNHDPVLDASLPGTVADEIWLGGLVLRHQPRAGAAGEIAGHLHPVAAVMRRGRRLRCRCFAGDGERLILPAFGAYTGGLSVFAAPFAPLFSGRRFTAWLIGRGLIYRIPATALLG